MIRNSTSQQCFRCGRWVRPNAGRVMKSRATGEKMTQHEECHQVFQGTSVHHVNNPEPLASVEVYQFHATPDTPALYFDVTTLAKQIARHATHCRSTITLMPEAVEQIKHRSEITIVDAMTVWNLRKAVGTHLDPVICMFDDADESKTHIIDGSHRAIARFHQGERIMPAWCIPKSLAMIFAMDLPPDLFGKPDASGRIVG